MLPDSIDYAEMSIARDLDLVSFHGTILLQSGASLQTVALPPGVVVLEELNSTTFVFEFDGFGNPVLDGFGNPIIVSGSPGMPLSPLSQAAIRAIYGGGENGPPKYFAVIGNAAGDAWTPAMQVLFGPTPDQNYVFSAYVTQRQAPLSASNPTTFISTQMPDLFWAASMIWWAGYLKSFGSMADDPKLAVSWESEYQRLLKSAAVEEARKRFQSSGWTPQEPTPIASQPRAAA